MIFKVSNILEKIFSTKRPIKYNLEEDIESGFSKNWILREHELHNQEIFEGYRTHSKSILTIGEVLKNLYDIKEDELSDLKIISNKDINQINEPTFIWKYDLLNSINISGLNQNENNHVIYSIKYRTSEETRNFRNQSNLYNDGIIIIHSTRTGIYKNNSNYFQINIYPPKTLRANNRDFAHCLNQESCKSFVVAHDFNDSSQALNEYEYIKEAISSHDKDITQSLSEKEWILLQHIRPDIGNEFYWGKKAFNEKRFLDAILYFKNVFVLLRVKWYKKGLNKKEMKLFTECAFLIGYSYNDLKLYEKAYSYLELAGRTNDKSYKYKTEFINCLVNSHNLLSIIYIDDYLDELQKMPENNRKATEFKFFQFLLRRKAYILIEMEQYDDAELILLHLLDKDPDNSYILNELAYIQTQKRQKNIIKEEKKATP